MVSPDVAWQKENNQRENPWSSVLNELTFANPAFTQAKEQFQTFYDELSDCPLKVQMDTLLENLSNHFLDENKRKAVLKAYVLGVALTQNNKKAKNDNPIYYHFRNNETYQAPEGELKPYPASVHFTRMLDNALKLYPEGLAPDLAVAIPLHDVVEDVQITHDNQTIQGASLAAALKTEFPEMQSAIDMVTAVTKYETYAMPQGLQEAISGSAIARVMEETISNKSNTKNPDQNHVKKAVSKAVSSIVKIFADAHEQAKGDDNEYMRKLSKSLILKGLDVADNLGSAGVSPSGLIRARILATVLRIMGSDLSNEIMEKLEKNHASPIPQDGTNQLNPENLIAQLSDHIPQSAQITRAHSIPLMDEHNSSPPQPGAQVHIVVNPDDFNKITIENIALAAQQAFTTGVSVKSFTGLLDQMIARFGRENTQYIITAGEQTITVRIMTNEPFPADYAATQPPQSPPPEAKFFTWQFATPTNGDPPDIWGGLLRMQLIMLDPKLYNEQYPNKPIQYTENGYTT